MAAGVPSENNDPEKENGADLRLGIMPGTRTNNLQLSATDV
jgi:hypothetical protein